LRFVGENTNKGGNEGRREGGYPFGFDIPWHCGLLVKTPTKAGMKAGAKAAIR